MIGEVITRLLESEGGELKVGAVWMTGEEGDEEKKEERDVKDACAKNGVDFKVWVDEKYFVDEYVPFPTFKGLQTDMISRDVLFQDPQQLPDIFTTYRKSIEPLRNQPRGLLSTPKADSLPPFPTAIPQQHSPFSIPDSLFGIQSALLKPLTSTPMIKDPPSFPENTQSAHPLPGGETDAHKRLSRIISSSMMTTYHSTRNGLLGTSFSSKLSAYLAHGCITARKIHAELLAFEDGTNESWACVAGYGKGENEGTTQMRVQLLWRDYMRLCTRKFGNKLFRIEGFKAEGNIEGRWIHPSRPREGQSKEEVTSMLERCLNGTTGIGLIDASLRELYLTGYTSNRARQNVASFLTKHLHIDWRFGAEWFESMLVDYDLSSNWGNWQYLAGVGNDPRGERILNPIKQAFDYDPKGEYVKAWVPETRGLSNPEEIFQAWTCRGETLEKAGLQELDWVKRPLIKIEFTVGRRGNGGRRGQERSRGHLRGGHRGRGEMSVRGGIRGGYKGRGGDERLRGYPRGGYKGSPDSGSGEKGRTNQELRSRHAQLPDISKIRRMSI
jgi:deoxyribodipyrimidine photo-lyase